jgi:subtilisin family serine protease
VRVITNSKTHREYKADEVLVRFKKGVAVNKVNALHSHLGTSSILESRMVKRLQLVKLPRNLTVEKAIRELKKSGLVMYAEPNWKGHILAEPYPNDPLVQIKPQEATDPLCDGDNNLTGHETDMWDLQMVNQCTSLDPLICESGYTCGGNNAANADVSVLPCTDGDCTINDTAGAFTDSTALTTEDVIVMSIDTGVDYTNPELAGNMWINPGEVAGNGLDDDQNGIVDDVYGLNAMGLGAEGPGCNGGFGDPMDDNSHGSHTSSTMVARAKNFGGHVGMGGLSNKVKVMACRWLDANGGGFASDAIKCFEYAYDMKMNHGQNIVASNNSWGIPSGQAMEDAIAANRDAGIIAVFAAGNATSNNDVVDTLPANMDVDNIISVGAYNQHDCASGFSNWGSRSVDIFAPGSAVLGVCPWNSQNCSGNPNLNFAYFSGTSMAAPHVTGLIGMMKAINPDLTMAQLRNIVLSTGVGSSKDDTACSSIPLGDDLDAVTTSYYYPSFQSFTGDGTEPNKKSVTDKRINALRAVEVAASAPGTPGDYDAQGVLWPRSNGSGQEGVPVLIKAINANGQNVGGPGSITADVTFRSKTPIFMEPFSGGSTPAGWTVVNGGDCDDGWRFDDPAFRSLFDGEFAIADSDFAGFCNMDTSLTSPVIDASSCDTTSGNQIFLDFKNNYADYFPTSEVADVNVSTDAFGSSSNVLSMTETDFNAKSIDISAAASDNPATTQVEFRYHDAYYSYFWGVDDVAVSCLGGETIECGSVTLLDDGVFPDQIADDGIFALNFVPGSLPDCTGPGIYDLAVNINGAFVDTVSLDVSAAPGTGIPTTLPDALSFGFTPVGQTKSIAFKLRNNGDSDLEVTGASFDFGIDYSFDDFGGTYPITVASGAQITGMIHFLPTLADTLTDTLTIQTDGGDATVDVTGIGVGPVPDIHVDPSSFDFGAVSGGSPATAEIMVENHGTEILQISGIDFTDPNLSTNAVLPLPVNPGSSTILEITWTAPLEDTTLNTQAVIVSNDPDEAGVIVSLKGTSRSCLFSDDFEAPNLDTSIWTLGGNASFTLVAGDMVAATTKKGNLIATGFAGCGDNCTIHTTMATSGGDTGKFALVAFYTDKDNLLAVTMVDKSDKWMMTHTANGISVKQKATLAITPGTSYDIDVTYDGTNFVLSVNGAPLITLPKVPGSTPFGTVGYVIRKSNGNSSSICVQ